MIPSFPRPATTSTRSPRRSRPADSSKHITGHWRAQFALPENGPKGLEETAYYVDYQGVRISR